MLNFHLHLQNWNTRPDNDRQYRKCTMHKMQAKMQWHTGHGCGLWHNLSINDTKLLTTVLPNLKFYLNDQLIEYKRSSTLIWVKRVFFFSFFSNTYRTRANITCSWFETALDYKPQILDPEIEEFPCLVHKLSVALTALQYKLQWKMG